MTLPRDPSRLHRRTWLTAACATAFILSACGKKMPRSTAIAPGSAVLALGDSLTSGVGAGPESAYPTVLAELTGWNVINGGVSGDTSAQALARLPVLLTEYSPALVIVSIGGNDFLRQLSLSELESNVRAIVGQCRASGAQVALVAIPQASMLSAAAGSLKDHGVFDSLAKELQLPLFEKGWSQVLSDAQLRSDTVHANAAGYAQFAASLARWLRDVGLRA
ncbi:GDSL-type esterase/lipase family protein [Diaphorobacter sp.]|uniref:GDSL-type esterase/lipase family protein n=1 Tax=Diaphorobacter sp. TaxID=1934310 RepID=UPI0028AEB01E|nr:GDSL-type esterase/lipase family protein [Diaphorobacter sp.]